MDRWRTAFLGLHIILFAAAGTSAPAEDTKSNEGYDERAYDMHYGGCIDWRDGRACTNLAYMYAEGRTVAKDEAKAAELFERGCTYNDPRGCTAFAMALVSGAGVEKDEAKAAKFFEKGCDRDDLRGCTNLGFLYTTGRGVPKDESKALELYQKACDGGNPTGCNNILGYHVATCQSGDGERCLEGGRRAQAMLKQPGLPSGVQLNQSLVAQFMAEATRLLGLACDARKAQSCDVLASMYAKGEGVEQDKGKSDELYRRACEMGLATACAQH